MKKLPYQERSSREWKSLYLTDKPCKRHYSRDTPQAKLVMNVLKLNGMKVIPRKRKD